MKKNSKILYILAAVFTVLFGALAVALQFVDVAAIGPEGTSVGFAGINGAFHEMTGVQATAYGISEVTGAVGLLTAAVFALIGLIQLIKRRSFLKVDKSILLLGALYVALGVLYVAFDKIVVNYRPILEDGALEASYPSSHTMLAVVIYSTAIVVFSELLGNTKLVWLPRIAFGCLMIITVVGRLLSGYHWLTDIVGGLLIGIALILWYLAVRKTVRAKEKAGK